jgi:hypothetical protein
MSADDRRRWYVFGTLLVVAGAGLSWILVRPMLLRGAQERAQIEQDAVSLSQFLTYDFQVEAHVEDEAWGKRKPLYDDAMLARLREALNAFVDLEVAQYGDAKDIYLSGVRPENPSDAARAAQARVRAAFPTHGEEIIRQFKEGVLEKAYKASPVVGGGVDPDLPRYDATYDDLVANFLPKARARIEEMTKSSQH